MRVLILLAIFGLANILHADVTVCSMGDLERSVEVIYSDPGQSTPCEVLYTKLTEGGSSTPWRAEVEGGYCEEKAAGLIERLVDWGWGCATAEAESQEEPAAEAS